jgi:hypothetical protein
VTVIAFFRRLARRLTPPGNRGSLDTEYRQPSAAPERAELEPRPPRSGNWAGPWGGV